MDIIFVPLTLFASNVSSFVFCGVFFVCFFKIKFNLILDPSPTESPGNSVYCYYTTLSLTLPSYLSQSLKLPGIYWAHLGVSTDANFTLAAIYEQQCLLLPFPSWSWKLFPALDPDTVQPSAKPLPYPSSVMKELSSGLCIPLPPSYFWEICFTP